MSEVQFALLAVVVAFFAIVRGIVDCRQRRYGWGVAGIVLGLALLLAPVQTHAVKIDLPAASR